MRQLQPRTGVIYAIGIAGTGMVKIGHTRRPLAQRLAALQHAHAEPLSVLASTEVLANLEQVEKAIHHMLDARRSRGEWFAVQMDQEKLDALVLQALTQSVPAVRLTTEGMPPVIVGPLLKKFRTRLGISQAELSRRSGVRAALISELEGGKKLETQTRILQRLARVLGVTTVMLIGEDPSEH